MGSSERRSPQAPPDFQRWAAEEIWTLEDAALLWCGADPEGVLDLDGDPSPGAAGWWPCESRRLFDLARDAIDAGSLPDVGRICVESESGTEMLPRASVAPGARSRPVHAVRPRDFARWALAKGFAAPPELLCLLDGASVADLASIAGRPRGAAAVADVDKHDLSILRVLAKQPPGARMFVEDIAKALPPSEPCDRKTIGSRLSALADQELVDYEPKSKRGASILDAGRALVTRRRTS